MAKNRLVGSEREPIAEHDLSGRPIRRNGWRSLYSCAAEVANKAAQKEGIARTIAGRLTSSGKNSPAIRSRAGRFNAVKQFAIGTACCRPGRWRVVRWFFPEPWPSSTKHLELTWSSSSMRRHISRKNRTDLFAGRVAGIVEAVLGLDNRPQASRILGAVLPTATCSGGPRPFPSLRLNLASLYNFLLEQVKASVSASSSSVGGIALRISRIFLWLEAQPPQVSAVSVDHGRINPPGIRTGRMEKSCWTLRLPAQSRPKLNRGLFRP